jgi:carbon-monoxide dehydrogenase large subunit
MRALIKGIDRTAALAVPGVVAVYTEEAADKSAICRRSQDQAFRRQPPSRAGASTVPVRHVGDIVAMIVAGTLDQARDAAEALAVDYEALPPRRHGTGAGARCALVRRRAG